MITNSHGGNNGGGNQGILEYNLEKEKSRIGIHLACKSLRILSFWHFTQILRYELAYLVYAKVDADIYRVQPEQMNP